MFKFINTSIPYYRGLTTILFDLIPLYRFEVFWFIETSPFPGFPVILLLPIYALYIDKASSCGTRRIEEERTFLQSSFSG
jgi:hypothetical protein